MMRYFHTNTSNERIVGLYSLKCQSPLQYKLKWIPELFNINISLFRAIKLLFMIKKIVNMSRINYNIIKHNVPTVSQAHTINPDASEDLATAR